MSNIELFGSDKVKNLVTETLYGCDDGEFLDVVFLRYYFRSLKIL